MDDAARARIERIRARILAERSGIAQAGQRLSRPLTLGLVSTRLSNIEKIFLTDAILQKDWSSARWEIWLKAAEDEMQRAEELRKSTETIANEKIG